MPSPFRHPYIIGLHDTDAAGVIYSANIIRICIIGYEALLAEIGYGVPVLFRRRTMGLPIVHIEADFQKPLTAGEPVTLLIRVESFGRTSFRMAYEVINNHDERCATAATVHVCTDLKSGSSMELPPEFRQALAQYA